jgi:adenylyltransferase/sulfurtransferase
MHTDAGAARATNKAESAARAVRALNPSCTCVAAARFFDGDGASVDAVRAADVVVDATDNVATRYLLNDACVLAGTPLVSGAAIGTDGQATVYGYAGGACYRCRYVRPPGVVRSCGDAGVLGPVPGLIGCMLAMEAIKVVAGMGRPLSERLYHYDALEGRVCVLQLPPRRKDCAVCGDAPSIACMADCQAFLTAHGLAHGARECSRDAAKTAAGGRAGAGGGVAAAGALSEALRISCVDYARCWYGDRGTLGNAELSDATAGAAGAAGGDNRGRAATSTPPAAAAVRESQSRHTFKCPHVLLDVRPRHQFEICALPGAVNMPLKQLKGSFNEVRELQKRGGGSSLTDGAAGASISLLPVFVMCRRGNSSAKATRLLAEAGFDEVKNIDGGLTQWVKSVDPDLAMY